jgi:aryl-phospho-beta-D-glucosidase BglC (GH1 family)
VPDVLQVRGRDLVAPDGSAVLLRGVGLGGWMCMENFITGYPSTESLQRQALRRVLGEEAYEAFFDRLMAVFFADADARFLASIGVNCVRIPFSYRHFEDDDRPRVIKESGIRLLDRAVEACARNGIYTILDLHAAPGYQNGRWHSDNPTHHPFFWAHRDFQDRAIHLWEALADHYRSHPWVAGYNVLNEPADPAGDRIMPFYRRVTDAIRRVDPDHVLFLEGNDQARDFSIFDEPLENAVYACHDYALAGLADGGEYPGLSFGTHVDRAYLERQFLKRTEYMRRTGTPLWVGEFGPVYTGDGRRDEQRSRILADQLDIYAEHDASWSLWTYKDIGLQGMVHVRPGSAYLARIEPVLRRKSRLGVDGWGSARTPIDDIVGPIDQVLAGEYPDFDPKPFGRERWTRRLVREMLLAEPMVEDFARCFVGVGAAEAAELADAFAFDACVVRQPLVERLIENGRLPATPTPPSPSA